MSQSLLLPLAALVGAAMLIGPGRTRWLAVVAVVAAGIEVARAMGWLSLSVSGLPLDLILAAVLAVAGVVLVLRAHRKASIVAATVVTAVGALQLLTFL